MKSHHRFSIAAILAVAGLVVADCAHFQPRPESQNAKSPEEMCEELALIDNLEDADDQLEMLQGRGGYYYSYVDEAGSTIDPPTNSFTTSEGGAGGSDFALRMYGQMADHGAELYAGMGVAFIEPVGPYNATKYTGVSFIAKKAPGTTPGVRFSIPDINTDEEGGVCSECYNHFGLGFQLTEKWTRYVVYFADLKQEEGWGDPHPQALATDKLFGLQWQVTTPGVKFDVWVDDIRFLGCKEEEKAPSEPASLEEEPEAEEQAPEAAEPEGEETATPQAQGEGDTQ